jgi:hypothetical protein
LGHRCATAAPAGAEGKKTTERKKEYEQEDDFHHDASLAMRQGYGSGARIVTDGLNAFLLLDT